MDYLEEMIETDLLYIWERLWETNQTQDTRDTPNNSYKSKEKVDVIVECVQQTTDARVKKR